MHRTQALITKLVTLALALGVTACGRIGYGTLDCDAANPACPRDAGADTLGCDAASPACPRDGVPAEHDGHGYVSLETPRTYSAAVAACTALGGRLARIDDQAEHDFAWTQAQPNPMWLAGEDQAEEGVWLWPDDGTVFWRGLQDGVPTPGVYTNWGPGEPNDSGDGEDCLSLWPEHDGRWADESCEGRSYAALCESAR